MRPEWPQTSTNLWRYEMFSAFLHEIGINCLVDCMKPVQTQWSQNLKHIVSQHGGPAKHFDSRASSTATAFFVFLFTHVVIISDNIIAQIKSGIWYYAKQTRLVQVVNSSRQHQRKEDGGLLQVGVTSGWWTRGLAKLLLKNGWKTLEFEALADELSPYISPDPSSPRIGFSVEKKLGITLHPLKDTGSITVTANAFGVSALIVSKTIRSVCSTINTNLAPTDI